MQPVLRTNIVTKEEEGMDLKRQAAVFIIKSQFVNLLPSLSGDEASQSI